ncbi:hypothetical protein REC12_01085 [Desulfosporosinus sp. PR]|uniref:hypothetical protein n=1 Tax=Candidatus Desulfosporosinus nitrosoreducens TaxID=3401928 RepID=UPI0027FA0865|nr:hypothetical protein [Desulfosporosinus sp. PR]MDQ7092183.1 hypothetical protein [Desulfosporosinus sp. PR]
MNYKIESYEQSVVKKEKELKDRKNRVMLKKVGVFPPVREKTEILICFAANLCLNWQLPLVFLRRNSAGTMSNDSTFNM